MTRSTGIPALRRSDHRRLPLQEQLYVRVRRAIAEGRLKPGERLPSTRSLASQLGVARGTVDAAYARLAGEGYLLACGPAGTVVSPALRVELRRPHVKQARVRAPRESGPAMKPRPFQLGLPALDVFPRVLWARLIGRSARRLTGGALAYPHPAGCFELRMAIAAYLAVSRGVACEPGQVIITAGYQAAVSVLARMLLRPGNKVWFEEPGYFLARDALRAASARLVPVPVDADGMRVDLAQTRAPDARLAVVTPAHQSPLGVALALDRRQALLAWAVSSRAWIIEDDYDSEFHYVGRKLPALKSIDTDDRVIYAGSFSKTLFPSLRLGYLVVPAVLVGRATEAMHTALNGAHVLEQMTVADFMSEGHFARHVKRMRALYAARRESLAGALVDTFGQQIELASQAGGMSMLARFHQHVADTDLVHRAYTHGLAPSALSSTYIGRRHEHGLLLGFTNIPENESARWAQALRRAIG